MAECNRSTPMTNGQKKILTEWMKKHPQLQSGLFSNNFTKKDAQNLWENITVTLNSFPGASCKTWKQWRKSWQDFKKNIKAKNSEINKYQRGTGGGPPLEKKLTDAEQEILSLQVSTSLSGNVDVRESSTAFSFKKDATVGGRVNEKQDDGPDAVINNNVHEDITEPIEINSLPIFLAINEQPPDPVGFEIGSTDWEDIEMTNQAEVKKTEKKGTTPLTGVTPKKKKFTTKSARLERSLTLTKDLVKSTVTHEAALERYYDKKIEIMEKEYNSKVDFRGKKIAALEKGNEIQSSIAAALNNIAAALAVVQITEIPI